MTDSALVDRARMAHLAWRSRLREAIETGKSPLTVEEARSDRACEFGKWLYGLPPASRQTEAGMQVQALHAAFHAEAAAVLGLALRGRRPEAEAAMALGSKFATILSELSRALEKFKAGA